jgi:hypothetical protein
VATSDVSIATSSPVAVTDRTSSRLVHRKPRLDVWPSAAATRPQLNETHTRNHIYVNAYAQAATAAAAAAAAAAERSVLRFVLLSHSGVKVCKTCASGRSRKLHVAHRRLHVKLKDKKKSNTLVCSSRTTTSRIPTSRDKRRYVATRRAAAKLSNCKRHAEGTSGSTTAYRRSSDPCDCTDAHSRGSKLFTIESACDFLATFFLQVRSRNRYKCPYRLHQDELLFFKRKKRTW